MKKIGLNFLDKAIAFVNPQAAVDRLASRAKLTAFEYDATQYNRQRRGPSSLSGAEGFRSNYDRVELLKRSRDLAENVGLIRGLLMKFASHCAGNISYQARTESPKVNTDVEAYWNEWWDKCDLSGRNTGSFLMQVAMMSMLRDGDFLFALVRDQNGNLKLQGIEADRVGDPNRTYTSLNLISGIHIDQETGAPTGYDIYLRTFGNAYIFQTTIPASQAFHLYDPLRIDQYRGISAFHTAINDCVDLYEIIASEKMAAKLASSQAGIVKRNNNNASDLSTLTNDLNADNQGIKLETIEPGKISYLEVNEDIVFPDGPSRPSGAFAEFHRILLRNICMGVGIPYSFAVDPSMMSGPTARLEMQQAGRTFRRYQKLLEDKVLRPLKNIVIADGVARGLIANNLGSKSTKGIFNFGANVSIDLGRESQANIAEFRAGLTTASSIYAEKGLDFESSMRQRALEAKLVKDLSEQYGVQASSISDTILGSIAQPSQDQAQDGEQSKQAEQTYVADQALNGAQVASLIQVINAVASGAVSKEGSISIITAAFPFISPEEASKIVEGINIGTIAPSTKTPTPTQAIPTPEKMEDEPQDENAVVVVPPIKEQDTATRTTGGDGDIDVGEEREPTEKGATEDTEKVGGKQIENNLKELSSLDAKSFEMIYKALETLGNSRKKRNTLATPDACPVATQDVKTNLKNRQTAVSDANYGPANPNEPNDAYWKAKASEFQGDVATAKKMLCGNCAAFNQTSKVLGCIKKGIGEDANEVAIGGNLGYCEIFDFKCAAKRTCDAWIVGGPLTDDKKKVETEFSRDCGQVEDGTFGPDNKCAEGYGRPALKGGYEPKRPIGEPRKDSAKETPKTKEQVLPKSKTQDDGHTYDKDGNIVIPKYQLSGRQKAGSVPIPSKGAKIFNGKVDERDWMQYRNRQLVLDQDAVWKVGELKMKGENLDFKTWKEKVNNDVAAYQVKDDFKGDQYIKINTAPESKTSQTLLKVFEKQAPHKQTKEMWRGMAFETKEETDNFIKGISGGMTLNRTFTSFSPDKSVAGGFAAGATGGPLYLRLTKSNSLRQFDASKSLGEQEYVLPYKSKIRMIGKPRQVQYRKNGPFVTEVDIEEY